MGRLAGRVALITGAAAGIGFAIAKLFASEGARVFINDVSEGNIAGALSKLTDSANASGAVADVSDADAVAAMMEDIRREAGQLDILVNNAGIMMRTDFRSSEPSNWERVLQVHVNGTINCTRSAYPLMRAGKNPNIINMASVMAHKHMRQLSSYSTAKGAIISFTRAVALEYAPLNIRVNAVAPGYVETALSERFLSKSFIREYLLRQTPMRRFGEVDEVAKAVLFLASDDASYITGTTLTVDGGLQVTL